MAFYTLLPMIPNLLIIDDDRELCSLLTDFLKLEGFQASAVHDGAEAVAHCREQRYDAIVLDVMLPGLQGLEVLRKLREFSDTPILMLTTEAGDDMKAKGRSAGATGWLVKPFDPSKLLEVAAKVMP